MVLEYKFLEARPNLPTNGNVPTNLLNNPLIPSTNLIQTNLNNYIKQSQISSFNSM